MISVLAGMPEGERKSLIMGFRDLLRRTVGGIRSAVSREMKEWVLNYGGKMNDEKREDFNTE